MTRPAGGKPPYGNNSDPPCSCGKWPMRFCVTQYRYCGKQAVSISDRWREFFASAEAIRRAPR